MVWSLKSLWGGRGLLDISQADRVFNVISLLLRSFAQRRVEVAAAAADGDEMK